MCTSPSKFHLLLAKLSPVARACSAETRMFPWEMTTVRNTSAWVLTSISEEAASTDTGWPPKSGGAAAAAAASRPARSGSAGASACAPRLRQIGAMDLGFQLHAALLQLGHEPACVQLLAGEGEGHRLLCGDYLRACVEGKVLGGYFRLVVGPRQEPGDVHAAVQLHETRALTELPALRVRRPALTG